MRRFCLSGSFVASLMFTATAFAQQAPAQQAPAQQQTVMEASPIGPPTDAPPQYQEAPPPPPPDQQQMVQVPVAPAEEELAPNSIYIEGLGAGLLYSINYERLVVQELGIRLGFSYFSFGASAGGSSASVSSIQIPLTASYLGIRSGGNILELGGGVTIISASGSSSGGGITATGSGVGAVGVLMVGYRLHPMGSAGFQFRVGAMALIGPGTGIGVTDPDTIGFQPWGYISLGGSF